MELLGKNTCDHIVGSPAVAYMLYNCPRCLGKGSYGDVSFNRSGKLNTIENISQLNQQIEKLLIENIRNTGYGFDNTLLEGVIDAGKLLAIKRELIRAINYFINNQQKEKATGFYYKTTEELYSIVSIDVFQDNSEPRKVIALVKLMTVSGLIVSVSSHLTDLYSNMPGPSTTPPVVLFELDIPLVGNVTANTATVVWATTHKATSRIIYGVTPLTMTNEEYSGVFEYYHTLILLGLELEQYYYCQIYSISELTGEEIHSDVILFFTGKEITIQNIFINPQVSLLVKQKQLLTVENILSEFEILNTFDPDGEGLVSNEGILSVHDKVEVLVNNVIGNEFDYSVTP